MILINRSRAILTGIIYTRSIKSNMRSSSRGKFTIAHPVNRHTESKNRRRKLVADAVERKERKKKARLLWRRVVWKARDESTVPIYLPPVRFESPRFTSSFEIVARCWATRYIFTGRAKRGRPQLSRRPFRRVGSKSNDRCRTRRYVQPDRQTYARHDGIHGDGEPRRKNAPQTLARLWRRGTRSLVPSLPLVSWYCDSLRRADVRDELIRGALQRSQFYLIDEESIFFFCGFKSLDHFLE